MIVALHRKKCREQPLHEAAVAVIGMRRQVGRQLRPERGIQERGFIRAFGVTHVAIASTMILQRHSREHPRCHRAVQSVEAECPWSDTATQGHRRLRESSRRSRGVESHDLLAHDGPQVCRNDLGHVSAAWQPPSGVVGAGGVHGWASGVSIGA